MSKPILEQLPWPYNHIASEPGADLEKLGGEDYNPEGSGWFKPWATCPTCGETLIAWTDKVLLERITTHCEEVGCALPQL